MLSRMLTRSQMALLCLGLFLALALCGAWQAFAWGRTQLDTVFEGQVETVAYFNAVPLSLIHI